MNVRVCVVSLVCALMFVGTAFGGAPPSAGLEAWFDGTTISEADGTGIEVWADSSGNGRDARRDSDGFGGVFTFTPPEAGTDTIGTTAGAKIASFDGVMDQMGISDGTAMGQWHPAQGSYTILVLAKTPLHLNDEGFLGVDGRGYLVGQDINQVNPGDAAFGFGDMHDHPAVPDFPGELSLTASDDGFGIVNSADPSDADGSWHIYSVIVKVFGVGLGSEVTLNKDGVNYPTRVIGGDGIFGSRGDNPITIANSFGGGENNALHADFAQILIYSEALGASTFNAAVLFIEQTYGLNGGPPGDFDGDGDVDGDDFLEWQTGFGTIYDGDDFLIWQQNFPTPGSGTGSGAVPEPGSGGLALIVAALLGPLTRHRRRRPIR